jgi:hypothetical protein
MARGWDGPRENTITLSVRTTIGSAPILSRTRVKPWTLRARQQIST